MTTLFGAFLIAAAIYYAVDKIVDAIDSLAVSIEDAGDDDDTETEVWRGSGE